VWLLFFLWKIFLILWINDLDARWLAALPFTIGELNIITAVLPPPHDLFWVFSFWLLQRIAMKRKIL